MNAIRVSPEEIAVGRALPWATYDVQGRLLLQKGFIVQSARQLEALLQRGMYRKSSDAGPAASPERPPAQDCPFDIVEQLPMRLADALRALTRAQTDGIDVLLRCGRDVEAVVDLDSDAALGAVHLSHGQSYAIMHQIHIALLCELIMRRLDFAAPMRASVRAAALTCNIGMLEIQDALNAQSEPLTDAQQEIIRRHPNAGRGLLERAAVTDALWLDCVQHHHERTDGSGYSAGLHGEQIPRQALIIALADMYCAMITPRAYRQGVLAKQALREIFLERGRSVSEELAVVFIKELGVFPPGAFVALENGEVAVVTKRGRDGVYPVVSSLISPRGGPYAQPLPRVCDREHYVIRDMVPRDVSLPVNPRRIWGYA